MASLQRLPSPILLSPLPSPTPWDLKSILGIDNWARASLALLPISGTATARRYSGMLGKTGAVRSKSNAPRSSCLDFSDVRPQTPELVTPSPRSSTESATRIESKEVTKDNWRDFMVNKNIPEGFELGESPMLIPGPIFDYDVSKTPSTKSRGPRTPSPSRAILQCYSLPESSPQTSPKIVQQQVLAPVYEDTLEDLFRAPVKTVRFDEEAEEVEEFSKQVEQVEQAELERIRLIFDVERPLFGTWQKRKQRQ